MEYGTVVVWWAAYLALAAAGLPIAALVLAALPDRGAGLALPVALLVLFVPVYWLGHLRFGPLVMVVGAVAVAGASVAASRLAGPVDLVRFLEWAIVFSLAYLLLVAVRAVDPSILTAGGEKFLDYGLLRSLLRASALPPEDFWFAGEPVQYYYGGHLLAAALSTLTGTAARYGYNLALAGFYAALVGAAYGVGGSIGAVRGTSYRLAGGLSAFLVGVASNVAPLLQAVLWALPDGVARPIAAVVAERTRLPAEALVSPDAFSYWDASRVIEGVINEFPLFAFLNGDLHAHMMSTPFLLLAVGIGLAYALTPAEALRRRRLLVYGAAPVVAGALAVINTWSFPSVAGVIGLSVLFAQAPARDLLPGRLESPALLARKLPRYGDRDRIGGELVGTGSAVLAAAGVALVGVLWALPFFLGPATGAEGRSIGFLPERSGLLSFLLVHGWFLLVFGLHLLTRPGSLAGRRGFVLSGVLVFVVAGALVGAAPVALVLALLALAWFGLRREADLGYEGVLFVAGAGLVLLVEFVYVIEQAGSGRYNTVFKTYMQVWVLWATGAGAAAVGLASRVATASTREDDAGLAAVFSTSDDAGPTSANSTPLGARRSTGSSTPDRRRLAAGAFVAILVASSSVYGVAALGEHFDGASEPTLDATTWARTYHADEWEAIQYLDGRPGRPTIVGAPGCWCNDVESITPYGWANAPATFTGLPTVAGWSHEVGYRGEAPYMRRVEDVRRIYTGSPEARADLLADYDVRYVYVGPNERALYGDVAVGDTPGLSIAFENEAVTVYAVNATAS